MLSAATARYAAFFRQPDVTRLVVMALIARMPLGTVNLAMLLHVRAITGSYADRGRDRGRLPRRRGHHRAFRRALHRPQRRTRRAAGHRHRVSGGAARHLARAVAGIVDAGDLDGRGDRGRVRAAGRRADAHDVATPLRKRARPAQHAFALDSVVVELVFTAGPALVALLLAIGSPAVAFGAAFTFATLAVPVFAASPAMRYLQHDRTPKRHLLGPLTEGKLLVVYATTLMTAFSLGLLEVAYPGFATQSGHTPLAGVLIAINSIGSAAGGLLYGGMHVALPVEKQLRRLLVMLALSLALQAAISSVGLLMVAALFAGLCIAPTVTIASVLVSTCAPRRYATEAFTWSTTCIVTGIGAGNALGGLLVERSGASVVFLASAAAALGASICALALRPGSDR